LGVLLLLSSEAECQDVTKRIPVKQALEQIERQHGIRFNYESRIVSGETITIFRANSSLEDKLKSIESQTTLVFSKIENSIYAIFKTYSVCGYILDGENLSPLEGATIHSGNSYTESDAKGYFSLKIRSDVPTLTIRYLGYEMKQWDFKDVSSSICPKILLSVETETINPIVLRGYLIKGIDMGIQGDVEINFSKFSLLPGLIEADVLQTLQSLPGIHSIDETISNLSIRGGSHDQNLILWDGIKMYQSGHFFGLISSFNPNITHKATFIQNGTNSDYTDGVSGTIDLRTDDKITEALNGSFSLNFLSADAFADIPISDKSSIQLAARKSINDLIETPTYESYFDRVTQETELLNTTNNNEISSQDFEFYDTSLRWLYNITENDLLRFNFIFINNKLSFEETNLFNQAELTKTSSLSQNSLGFGVNYKKIWNSRLSTELQIYETDYNLKGINANVELDQFFLQENKVSETGVSLINTFSHSSNLNSSLGYQFVETEITNLSDVDNPRFRNLKSNVLRTHAIFYQGDFITDKQDLVVNVGGRLNYLESYGVFIAEPRLSASKKVSESLRIELAGEFKHQNSSQIINFQNDFLGIEKRRWQLTDNDSIPIIRSKQASLGVLYSKSGTLIDLKGYVKTVDGITTQSQGFTTKYEFEKEKGSYDVYGVEFLFRKKFKQFHTWLSYSYMNNTYDFENLEDSPFPSNFDITHSLSVGGTFSNDFLNISGGFNYRTGNPTTNPTGLEPLANEVIFETANSTRLKDYMRLDVSVIYKFEIRESLKSEIGASVWNLLNRQNSINNYYRPDDLGNVNQFSRFSLGTTANFVARVFF
jgi:hypothetical protein